MRNLLFTLLLLTFGLTVTAQSSLNLSLAGHVTNPANLNDVWGWVAPDNKEYAIAGKMNGGELIVDVTNPSSPVVVQNLNGIASTWRDMKTWSNYAYITNEAGDGIRIIDLSTLPGTVQYKDTIIQGLSTAHNLYIDNGYAYVVGGNTGNGGIMFLDLSDPWRPAYAGQYDVNYVHDIYVRNNVAYAGELGNGLTIIDVSNKSNPQVIGNRQYQGNFTHNTWLNDAGTVCFTTDEVSAGKLTAFDVSNLSNIDLLDDIQSSVSPDQMSIPHNTHVLNDYLVTSYYRDGLVIFDGARPHNLIEVGYYDTSNLSGDGFDGNWGAYPFLPSGNILVSDMDDGLFILGPTYVRGCYLEGEVTDAQTTFPIANASIDIQGAGVADLSNSTGGYATGTAAPGTFNVKYSKFGYQDSIISTTLTNGVLVVQDVPLQPLARINFTVTVMEEGTGNPIPNAKVLFRESSNSAQFSYTTNSNGIVNDPNFIVATYEVIAGKWGFRTKSVQVAASSTNNSIIIELPKGYYDDFALDFSWTVSGNASAGIWERGEPIGTFGNFGQVNPEDDIQSDISDECFMTGNGGGSIGADDVDDGVTILASPAMDLSSYVEPVVKYYRWFANGGGFGSPNDTLRIEVDNGNQTVVLKRVFGTNANAWVMDTFLLSNYIAPTSNMTVRFICGDYGAGHVVEGAVDVFEVYDLLPNAVTNQLNPRNAQLQVSPNPMQGTAMVSYNIGTEARVDLTTFEVHDLFGRLLHHEQLVQNRGSFPLDLQLAQGVYIGSLNVNGQVLKTFRILK